MTKITLFANKPLRSLKGIKIEDELILMMTLYLQNILHLNKMLPPKERKNVFLPSKHALVGGMCIKNNLVNMRPILKAYDMLWRAICSPMAHKPCWLCKTNISLDYAYIHLDLAAANCFH